MIPGVLSGEFPQDIINVHPHLHYFSLSAWQSGKKWNDSINFNMLKQSQYSVAAILAAGVVEPSKEKQKLMSSDDLKRLKSTNAKTKKANLQKLQIDYYVVIHWSGALRSSVSTYSLYKHDDTSRNRRRNAPRTHAIAGVKHNGAYLTLAPFDGAIYVDYQTADSAAFEGLSPKDVMQEGLIQRTTCERKKLSKDQTNADKAANSKQTKANEQRLIRDFYVKPLRAPEIDGKPIFKLVENTKTVVPARYDM